MHVDRADTDPIHQLVPKPRKVPRAPLASSPLQPGDEKQPEDGEFQDAEGDGDEDEEYEDENSQDEEDYQPPPGYTYVPHPRSPLPTRNLTEPDWQNALYQLIKYSTARSEWGSDAFDALREADREPISWLGYAACYGEDEVREVAPGKEPWREWDDALTETNPYVGWSAYLRLPDRR